MLERRVFTMINSYYMIGRSMKHLYTGTGNLGVGCGEAERRYTRNSRVHNVIELPLCLTIYISVAPI